MKYAFCFAALAAVSNAHTIFLQLISGGVTNPIGYAIRTPVYDGPIQDVTSSDIACNGGPNPTTPSSGIINVKAGDTVRAVWRHTLESTSADVIDPSHKGPLQAYLKKVTDATSDTGIGGGWFKISESGLLTGGQGSAQKWAVDALIANGGYQDIPIPSCIANGQYLLRAELLALHSAGSSGQAQFYMECAQINVSGGTGTATPATVSFPGAYKATDPGILINIYQNLQSYTIPGPRPLTCGAGSGPTSTTREGTTAGTTFATTTTRAVVTTTPVLTTTTARATTTTARVTDGGSCSVQKYGQCGGTGYTGCTTCATGATCSAVSPPFYSQCL